jgi:hypothetical protein
MARFAGIVTLSLALSLGSGARALAQPQNPTDLIGQWTSNINVPYTISLNNGAVTWTTPMGQIGTLVSAPGGLQTSWTDAAGMHTASGMVVARDAGGRPIKVQWSNGLIIERVGAQAAGVPVPGAPSVGAPPGTTPSVSQQTAQQATQQAMGLLGALVARMAQPQPPAPAAAPAAPVPVVTPPPPVATPTQPIAPTYAPAPAPAPTGTFTTHRRLRRGTRITEPLPRHPPARSRFPRNRPTRPAR